MESPPFKVKAVYEYVSEHDDDLQFPKGQIITVTELEGDDWYVGEYSDVTGVKKEGLFPTNFVEKYEPEVPTRPSRPSRPKQDVQSSRVTSTQSPQTEVEDKAPPQSPGESKSNPPVLQESVGLEKDEPLRSPPPSSPPQKTAVPPPAPVPAPAKPAEQTAPTQSASASAPKKAAAPPPVAAKSNAFRDRIAAFNQPAAAPIAPIQIGRKPQTTDFIKKPFVAPPPSKNAYVPPPKVDLVQKPYHREEDSEIKQRQEEDRAAAAAAGLTNEPGASAQAEDEEDAPKPMTLKERMALLQRQQQEQAQRRAEASHKKKAHPAKPVEVDHTGAEDAEDNESEQFHAQRERRSSSDAPRARPQVPLSQREGIPPLPDSEIVSDGHEADQSGAGDVTEDDSGTLGADDSEERSPDVKRHGSAPLAEPDVGDEDDTTERDVTGEEEEEEEEEEDSMDEEEKRKQALRQRMARLGGAQPGMGVMLGFGAPPAPPPSKKKASTKEKRPSEDRELTTEPQRVPMVPIVPIPGLARMQSPEVDSMAREDDEQESEDMPAPPSGASTLDRVAPPPVPRESRPPPLPSTRDTGAAPPVPSASRPPPESRPIPPLPQSDTITTPDQEEEPDDEPPTHADYEPTERSGAQTPIAPGPAPPPPGAREVPSRPTEPPAANRSSYFSPNELVSPPTDKRASRGVPPLPSSPPVSSRPAPPPPPSYTAVGGSSTTDLRAAQEDERVGSDYDGDYDTDIASGAKHRDALKAPHVREPSLTDDPISARDDFVSAPIPAIPQASAPRAVPPPPPTQPPPKTRLSMDRPPPPVPPPREPPADEEYDPYRYPDPNRGMSSSSAAPVSAPPLPPVRTVETTRDDSSADEDYEVIPPVARSPTDRVPPPPPPDAPPFSPRTSAPKQSLDVSRSGTISRRSTEGRPSGDLGQMATDIDLKAGGAWWTAQDALPPVFQSRNGVDLISECEESSKSKRNGRKEVTKDIYVLFMDYSQTIITVRYDSHDPEDVHLEQRHEAPPPKLRQDQLEAAWQQFGRNIAASASALGNTRKDSIAGDGSPASLPYELIKAQLAALLPVGTRSYGALIYANLANASTMQFDEIRPGDIVTVRNARFEGHHGAMKSKYKTDYGPSHVAIVDEWDGTKRAIRAWEQGREKKGGVRSEKFRLGDLRSGELRVWRVVARDWVGWDS